MNCYSIFNLFANDLKEINVEHFYKYALEDAPFTEDYAGAGYYQCYCKAYYSESSLLDQLDFTTPNFVNQESDTKTLCSKYQSDQFWAFIGSNSVTVLVSLINYLISLFNQYFINKICYDTRS